MNLKIWKLISIVLSAMVMGVFWGPWVALSRSIDTFAPEVFLAIVKRLSRNIAPVMAVLMPAALLSMVPAPLRTFHEGASRFYPTLMGFALFVVALLVTMFVEVPIVKQMETWTVSTLPGDWQRLRNRWQASCDSGGRLCGGPCLPVGRSNFLAVEY
ncbi:MAG: hypothetical protein WAK48_33345 [Candidatus Acidiferrum sp.]|jgi:hypothetical protein